jgi:electron transport complex protein RnfG
MTASTKKPVWAGGVILAALAAICTTLVALTHAVTAPRIAANEQAFLEQSLQPVLEGIEYDGKLSESTIIIPPPHSLPGNDAVTVYRVYADAAPVAALFVVNARGGFAGPIRLLIGVDTDGNVTGARVLAHRETPGLGDLIESDKSDWIQQFTGRSLTNPDIATWGIKRDGGEFDQLTGATITPRAVVRAIRETLVYYDENGTTVFAEANNDE